MSKKRIILVVIAVAVLLVAIFVFVKFFHHKKKRDNSIFREYISAYTSGVISAQSAIKVQLAVDYADTSMFNKPVSEDYFKFSPDIKGKAYWIDARTIKFQPDEKLPHDEKYDVKFRLNKIITVPDSLSTLYFDFQVMQQAFDMTIDNVKPIDKKSFKLVKIIGTVRTADIAEANELNDFLEATEKSKKFKVKWTHEEDKKLHHFIVDSITREDSEKEIILKWNTKKIDAESRKDDKVIIPALGDFKITNIRVVQSPDQFVLIQFSDPLLEKQDVEGFIKIDKTSEQGTKNYHSLANLRYFIEDNEIRAYPPTMESGTATISVENIKNIENKSLPKKEVRDITFDGFKPEVKFTGKGNIIPSSNGLILPFDAVNLRAVDVKIIKIYENNISQFLQVNDLSGEYELTRVGKVISNKRVMLTKFNVTDFAKWNRFSLDLAEFIKAEPGAIYRVILSINKEYSLYPCNGIVPKTDAPISLSQLNNDDDEIPNNNWGYYSEYNGDYEGEEGNNEDYNWNQREDPCNASYYENKTISQNVLASDIGLIAKKAEEGVYTFFVTDLVTTKPISDVTLELHNYQRQLIQTLKTDNDGMATTKTKKIPYLLVAKKDKQRGYLKLDGSTLSLSMFDVKGDVVQKGIKGFIYGDRGVWRPGDSLYLTFILEDKNKTLPENHPVTFDLVNPRGQTIKHIVKTTSVNRFYNFKTATEYNAPTGNWSARIIVGSAVFTKSLKIETVMPNRLKIALDFGKTKLYKGRKNTVALNARWLQGAIAKNLKTDIEVTLSQTKTQFSKFPDYTFDDPTRSFTSESHTLFNGKLDESGNASFNAEFTTEKVAPGVLKASFQTRVFEAGGAFSIDRQSMFYFPYSHFVGILVPEGDKYRKTLETGKTHLINLATVDPDGNISSSLRKLKVDVYRMQWHWWWDNENEGVSQYEIGNYNSPLYSTELTTKDGKCVYPFKVDYPDWGRFFIRVTDIESGHSTGKVVYIDWPNFEGRSHGGKTEAVTMLSFTSDKEKYKVGEKVKLNIPSGPDGRALVSIETGSKVLKTYWVETVKGFTDFSFEVTDEMAPNVYVFVTLLQPHAQTKNDLPIRLYGVIPISIEDPNTHLRPIIKMPDVLKPEEKASITIREENRKEMTYTIAIVDEGLLDLTRFQTPEPWSVFYAREALGVKTWDLFDYVMGAYGGQLERLFSIGGEVDVDRNKAAKNANRFKPMVKYIGPFHLDKGASKTHTFMMPNYVGSVRVMAVAGYNGAYGNSEKTVAVKKPLMILATLPRVIGPKESFKLPVDVFAMENNIKNVTVKVSANSLIKILGNNTKTTTFDKPGDNLLDFDLKANPAIGIGKVDVIATCGNETAKYSVEINVRNPNPKITNVIEAVIKAGETWSPAFNLPGISGTNKATFEVSSALPVNLDKRIKYLVEYPYGCVEQTTSSAFPQLYLSDLIDMPSNMKSELERNIKYAIQRLLSFQVSGGGLSFWPGSSYTDDWGTNYGGHFMIEAANKGYSVSTSFLTNWKKYQKEKANQWVHENRYSYQDLIQAYRLYTLALAKAPELGAMNRMREVKDLSLSSRWRLAAAYQLAGYNDIANQIINTLSTDMKPYRELSYTYGSYDRDQAMILETMTLMGLQSKAFTIAQKLSQSLCSDNWMSTQEVAYSLMAMSKFFKMNGKSVDLNYTYSFSNTLSTTHDAQSTKYTVNSPKMFSQNSLKINDAKSSCKAVIRNEGKGTIYARIITSGIPEIGNQSASSSNMILNVVFKSTSGITIDPSSIQQGTDFIAEATVANPGLMGDYQQLALAMVFPSGWEIRNTRMDEAESTVKNAAYTYQDFRDDRVYTYFDLYRNSSKTFRFQINASYLGEFYLPSIQAEAMYNETINARVPGRWVKVVK